MRAPLVAARRALDLLISLKFYVDSSLEFDNNFGTIRCGWSAVYGVLSSLMFHRGFYLVQNTFYLQIYITVHWAIDICVLTCFRQPIHQIWSSKLLSLRRYEQQYEMKKVGWFGAVMGYWRSSAVLPFDGVHTTSHSTVIVTVRLSRTVLPRDAMHAQY